MRDERLDRGIQVAASHACHAILFFGEEALAEDQTLDGAPLDATEKAATKLMLRLTKEALDADVPTPAQVAMLKAMLLGVAISAREILTEMIDDGALTVSRKNARVH
jgi:cyanate lyase